MEILNVPALKRAETGKQSNKIVRNSGRIPGVLYGGNSNTNFSVVLSDVKKMIYTPDFKVANLDIEGETCKAIIKDLQFHPVTDALLHIDFLRVIDGKPIKVEVPVRTKGVSPGVKAGGKLITQMRRVGIKSLPENMVSEVFVDISKLELGQSVRVRDLIIGEGVEVTTEGATPVAMIEIPRALKSAAAAEKKAAAGGKKK